MDHRFDSSYILYGIGALLGIAALLYFGQEVLLTLSPTIKAFLLILSFAAFLTGGIRTEETVSTVLLILSAGAYIIFLGYTILRFSPTTNQIFLGLAVSSALFIGIGYSLNEDMLELDRRQTRYLLTACIVVAALAVTGDIIGPQATATASFDDSINLSNPGTGEARLGTFRIGTMELSNPFPLSRTVDIPSYRACIVTDNSTERYTTRVMVRDTVNLLGGGEKRTDAIEIRLPLKARDHDHVPAFSSLGTIPLLQQDSCPETRSEPALIVTPDQHPPF
jgi:hypothetical protein